MYESSLHTTDDFISTPHYFLVARNIKMQYFLDFLIKKNLN